jgi:hypothetical protein
MDEKTITLTTEQLETLKADITTQVVKELTGMDLRTVQEHPKPLHDIWKKYKKPLYEKFGPVTYAQVWDCIRKLATFRAGHRYVRDLLPSEEKDVAEFAESILIQMGVEVEGEGA